MELVANVFAQSIQHVIEEDGILSAERGDAKLAAVFNMDQTAIYIDMAGKTTIDFIGSFTVDVQQATGIKLPPLIVFAGIPGGPVSQEVWNPMFGSPGADHAVQKKTFCNEVVMKELPTAALDSLKVHKMASVRVAIDQCCTQVQFVPPGITGLCQPMDIAVMKPFKDAFRYEAVSRAPPGHLFPASTSEKRALMSGFVVEAWNAVKPETIVKGFARAGVIPTGPRNQDGRFRVASIEADAPLVQDD
ncbi:Pogo transposable element with KRAB domain [Phytophthora citrophthora]|uniref:Pogo transposable element with KRAB domain n=1 Tax=Phytophthora citrophthora TaxID=4793 RepID=A0AAD9LJN8_9STRA|nr:Pogo transposable element with KRAB domain [Phytophthora citrophthora]